MMILINENVQNQFHTKAPGGFIPKNYKAKIQKNRNFLSHLKCVAIGSDSI